MFSKTVLLFYLLCCCCSIFKLTNAQNVPPIPCPEYFEYLAFNGMYIGRVNLPISGFGTTNLELQFTQRQPVMGQFGKVELFYSQERTKENLRQGKPLSYRVNFPYPNILPKLTRLTVNGQTICVGEDYPAPSSVIRMQHTLTLSETIIRDARPFSGSINAPTFTQPSFQNNFVAPTTQRFAQFPQESFINEQSPVQSFNPTQEAVYGNVRQQIQPRPVPAPTTPPRAPVAPTSPATTLSQNVQNSCGRRTSTFTPFIHHGTTLSPGQIPWLTAVYEKVPNGVRFLCGGSLVSSRTVITAAHCFKSSLTKDDIVLYIGKHNLNDYGEKFEIRTLANVVIHNEYNVSHLADADIAIMHLAEPIVFNNLISPICLWEGSTDLAQIVGQKGYVAGWGSDERGNTISSIPKMVNANIVDENECTKSAEGFLRLISSRTLCAGNLDRSGPCIGDSGGGLMIMTNGRWHLRAIVSAGNTIDGECNLSTYVIYCDLAKHMPWVQRNVLF